AAAPDERRKPLQRLGRTLGLVRPARHRKPRHRSRALVEQELEHFVLVVEHLTGAPRERDFDRALAELLKHVGVGLKLVAVGEAAGQRLATKANMLGEPRS